MIIGDSMSKIEEQNKIFKIIKETYKNKGSITDSDVYKIITEYGFTDKEKQKRTKKHLFGFKGETKTRGILLDDENIPFIPFSNNIDSTEELDTAIKMYISVDSKSLNTVYSELRDFIRKNSIKSSNKARNRVTNDDIVLRIPSIKDVELVRNFIKGNPTIKNSIKNSNPFLAQDELGICYSMDGIKTSVNNELSKSIVSYLESCNNLDEFTRDGFKKYLHDSKTNFYNRYKRNVSLFSQESTRVNNLLELSMDEDFDYSKMMRYAAVMQSFKNNLQRMNIEDLSSIVYNDLRKKHSDIDTINLICNTESLKEEDFNTPFLYVLSKTYLTNGIVLEYLSSVNKEDIERNNKKFV